MKNLILISMLSLLMMACVPIPVKASSVTDDSSVTTLVDEGSASVTTPEKSQGFTAKVAKAIGLDVWSLISMVLGLISVVAGSFWKLAKNKLKIAAELLTALANAIDDNRIDANEQKELSDAAKRLISKI